MRRVVIMLAIACAAFVAVPAFGDEDGAGMNKHHGRDTKKKNEPPVVRANDHDYNAALQRVPAPTQKYDPWGTMRPTNDKQH